MLARTHDRPFLRPRAVQSTGESAAELTADPQSGRRFTRCRNRSAGVPDFQTALSIRPGSFLATAG